MTQTITINNDLVIDLLPGVGDGEPALCLHTCSEPEQSLVVFLSEVYLLRDALSKAGARLMEIEAEFKKRSRRDYQTQPLVELPPRPVCPCPEPGG